jgi:hypothetical protein
MSPHQPLQDSVYPISYPYQPSMHAMHGDSGYNLNPDSSLQASQYAYTTSTYQHPLTSYRLPFIPSRLRLHVTVYFTFSKHFDLQKSNIPYDTKIIQMLCCLSSEKTVIHLRHRLAKTYEIIQREQGLESDG